MLLKTLVGAILYSPGWVLDTLSDALQLLQTRGFMGAMAALWFDAEPTVEDIWDKGISILNELPLAPLFIPSIQFTGGALCAMADMFFLTFGDVSVHDEKIPSSALNSETIPGKYEITSLSEISVPDTATSSDDVSISQERDTPKGATPTKHSPRVLNQQRMSLSGAADNFGGRTVPESHGLPGPVKIEKAKKLPEAAQRHVPIYTDDFDASSRTASSQEELSCRYTVAGDAARSGGGGGGKARQEILERRRRPPGSPETPSSNVPVVYKCGNKEEEEGDVLDALFHQWDVPVVGQRAARRWKLAAFGSRE